MKNIIIILTFTLCLFSGCDDVLEQTPITSIPEQEMFNNIEGMQGALVGVYNSISSSDYYGRLMYAYEGSKGPDFSVDDTGNRFEKENGYGESSSSGGYASDAWNHLYETIHQCNSLLYYIDNTTIEGEDDELKRIKGETLALRGLTYFDLMRLFAYPPIYSCKDGVLYQDKYKYGVPLITSLKQAKEVLINPIGRDLADDCYTHIISDFTSAATLLEGINPVNGNISFQAVKALLTRAYLYKNDWTNVITHGEEAIAAGGSMLPYSSYKTEYYKTFSVENIWELAYITTDHLSTNSLNYLVRFPTVNSPGAPDDGDIASETGYAGYRGNKYLRAVLRAEKDGYGEYRDVRSYLICDNDPGSSTGIRKYVGTEAHYLHNITMVRLPEIYLSVAEAYAEKDNLPKAEEFFNVVFKARLDSSYIATDQDQTISDILTDRRKELVLEGHNYWDHFRKAIPFDREKKGNVSSDNDYIDFTLPQVVYPIPQREMEANPNIREQQNPGYLPYLTD
ncbi:MAG: RagB/SusD family nutrient uptake outer membrane protein [Marinilabiliaceae bacterium]|nr:RagB/SusD family nutrient uptake outer membrane protein [Marinilabiliaceae bacterium]